MDPVRLGQEEVSEAPTGQNLKRYAFSDSWKFAFDSELLLKLCALGSSLTSPSSWPWMLGKQKNKKIHYTHVQNYVSEYLKSTPLETHFSE